MKTLLLSTNDSLALGVLQSLALESIRTDVMSPLQLRWASMSRYREKWVFCTLENLLKPDSSFANFINSYCIKEKIDIIIPVDVLSAACLAKIRDMITPPVFPIPTLSHILQVNNKWQFKELLDQLGIATPQTILLHNQNDIPDLNIQFPVMAKPQDSEGRNGIKRLNSKDDIEAYFLDEKNNTFRPLLLQEYIPGYDICCSVLSIDGQVLYWTIQERTQNGDVHFVENADILEAVCKITGNLSYCGLAHFDLRMDIRDNSIKFLECNPRFWGTTALSAFAGVNFASLGISIVLKQPRPEKTEYQVGLCLPEQVISRSLIKLLFQRKFSFNRFGLRYLLHFLCDPLLAIEGMRKRFAKIFIPGKIRQWHRKKRKKENFSIPPLSAIETYANH